MDFEYCFLYPAFTDMHVTVLHYEILCSKTFLEMCMLLAIVENEHSTLLLWPGVCVCAMNNQL